jgi:hypothetical protein
MYPGMLANPAKESQSLQSKERHPKKDDHLGRDGLYKGEDAAEFAPSDDQIKRGDVETWKTLKRIFIFYINFNNSP